MSEFVNTVDAVGDEALATSIIDGTIAEIVDEIVTTIGQHAFYQCERLTSVNFPNALTIGYRAFGLCRNLTSINLPNITDAGSSAFEYCSELTAVNIPNLISCSSNLFDRCENLSIVDLASVAYISHSVFYNCNKITALIMRNTEVVVGLYGTESFAKSSIASGTGYIYVPKALVESYKTATKWSVYANQIRAIEDYPEITGGETA